MSKVVIHIGTHKTGTSAIQKFCHSNQDLLLERGIYYKPCRPEENNHHSLAIAFDKDSEDPSRGPDLVERMRAEAGQKTILISSEIFCEHRVDADRFLESWGASEIRLLAYLRHPCDLLISAFNQVVKSPKTKWKRAVTELPFAYDPSSHSPLRRWMKPNLLQIMPYDPQQWPHGSIFHDFLGTLGVDPKGMRFDAERENVSIPFPLIEVLRTLNLLEIDDRSRDSIIEILQSAECNDQPYPLNEETMAICFKKMSDALIAYQPFLRPGFDEQYLFKVKGQESVLATAAALS